MIGPKLPGALRSFLTAGVFGVACIHYAWFAPFGSAQSGLFVYDQASLVFLIVFLSFLFLSEALTRETLSRPESAPLKITLGFLGSALLLSNNLGVLILALPVFLYFAMTGTSSTFRGQRARSGLISLTWTVLLLCLLCIGCGLFLTGGGTMNVGGNGFSNVAHQPLFMLGWSMIFALEVSLLFFYPFAFFQKDACEAGDWNAGAIFRIAPSIVFAGLLFKWCRVEPGLPGSEALQGLAISLSAVLFLVLLMGRNLLLVVHALALVPVTLLLWSMTDLKAAPAALAALLVFSAAVSRFIYLLKRVGVKPSDSVRGLHEALRAASFGLRLEFFVLGLSLMPLGTFLGFGFFVQLPFEASICGASLTMAIVLLLGRILELDQALEGPEVRLSQAESAIGVITLAALIVLGIYPTPLYNYIHYLSHLP
ncbi:MAG: hypothetical protein ABL958_20410, partial [Bdellovibrionia bacterium]